MTATQHVDLPASDDIVTLPSLYIKLAEVMSEVTHVGKDGVNDFQKYKYVSAEAMLGALRKPLYERRVVLLASLSDIGEREYRTSGNKASVVTTVRVKFTFVDADSGEMHSCEWAGQGDDPADKGLGKAYTNAIKTFLREQFLIPQGDDPEADSSTDKRAADRAPGGAVTASRKTASDQQKGLIHVRARDAHLTALELLNIIRAAAGADEPLTLDEASAAVKLNAALDRLPADIVTPVLDAIETARGDEAVGF